MSTLDSIESTDFENYSGQMFQARVGDYAGEWELMSVTPQPSSSSGAAEDAGARSFSLLFRAPANHRIPQGTYAILHPELGSLDIFMVPIRADKNGFHLEAVFNRDAE